MVRKRDPGGGGVGKGVSLSELPVAALRSCDGIVVGVNNAFRTVMRCGEAADFVGMSRDRLISIAGEEKEALWGVWRQGMFASPGNNPVACAISSVLGRSGATETVTDFLLPAHMWTELFSDRAMGGISHDELTSSLAQAMHEFRTPLNAIIGFSDLMKMELLGEMPEAYREYARDISESATYLLKIVNDVLDVSRLTRGKVDLDESIVFLGSTVQKAATLLGAKASERRVVLSLGDLGQYPTVHGDETRLLQVVVNLVSNAVKFSPPGATVRVGARNLPDDGVCLFVEDRGPGMTEEEIRIAQLPFGRTQSAISAREEGTGLGLPISKAIVEGHGGRLSIESEPGVGTVVLVELPAERVVLEAGEGDAAAGTSAAPAALFAHLFAERSEGGREGG